MSELIQAFVLGNSAILTNVCMLPLYPGMIAFLGGTDPNGKLSRSLALGALVLAGILSTMLAMGMILYIIGQSFAALLPWLLPLIYSAVLLLGFLLLLGRNPFVALQTVQAPLLRDPYAAAYSYGLLFGPMTLPCTGPILTTAILLSIEAGGSVSLGSLAGELAYFLAFGLGFGWPLLVLPLLAQPLQRRFIGWLTRHHLWLDRLSGILLVGIGLFGLLVEVLPNLA